MIHQEDIILVNIYTPNISAPKYIKKILVDFKEDIDDNRVIEGEFNNLLSSLNRSFRQKINKEASGQYGAEGRHTVPPHTTRRRINNTLKTKNNQN